MDGKLTTQENVPLKPLSLTYQTLRPFMASTGKLMSGPCLLQKLEKIWELALNIFTICLLSDWGGVCLCVESAPLGALVGVIVRNVEWVTGEHYLSAISRQLRGARGENIRFHKIWSMRWPTLYWTVHRLMSSVEVKKLSVAAAKKELTQV